MDGYELIDRSETYAVACIAPARFTRSRNFDDLTAPQAIVSSDRISKLYPRKLCLLQTAAALSDCREQGTWANPLRTIAPKEVFFVLGPKLRVVVPVYGVLYSRVGQLRQIPLA